MNLRSINGTLVLGFGALIVLLLAGWLLLISPVLGDTSEAHDEVSAAQDRNRLMTSQVNGLKQQQDQLPRYQAIADEMAALFPPTADQPGFFAAVNAAAQDAGIGSDQLTVLSPSAPVLLGPDGQPLAADAVTAEGETGETGETAAGEIAEQTVSVTAEGTFDQIQSLLANLEQLDRSFVVSTLGVDDGATGGQTVTLTGRTFVAAPLAYEPEGEG
ncbi:hypothetical protein [Nocardioides sambongensis]|uniref:hypothetical protein n=1 Tax=Nocardioides sambongensis TaxID=2589074 RepID=UPI001129C4C7|nr:hypothetical protein [Nocardioides sambongensis]